jgi:hypothetical protein
MFFRSEFAITKGNAMKRYSQIVRWLPLIVTLMLAGMAAAQGASQSQRVEVPPPTPEPGLLLMAISGLALGGGYVLWRRRQLSKVR